MPDLRSGAYQRVQRLFAAKLDSKLIDFSFFEFSPVFSRQILRVEQLSDAHLTFGESHVLVMYLREVTHRRSAHPKARRADVEDLQHSTCRHVKARRVTPCRL